MRSCGLTRGLQGDPQLHHARGGDGVCADIALGVGPLQGHDLGRVLIAYKAPKLPFGAPHCRTVCHGLRMEKRLAGVSFPCVTGVCIQIAKWQQLRHLGGNTELIVHDLHIVQDSSDVSALRSVGSVGV